MAALLVSLSPVAATVATAIVIGATATPAVGGGAISADTASGTWTTLSGPVITETNAGDVGADVVLHIPTGFDLRGAASGASVVASNGCDGTYGLSLDTGAATATLTVTTPSSAGPCTITFTGLQVRPTAGTPLADGAITETGAAVSAPSGWGELTEVAGAPVLTVVAPQPGSTTGGHVLPNPPKVQDVDQFDNPRVGDQVTLSIKAGTGTAGATLACTTNPVTTVALGMASFPGCTIDEAGTGYVLRATTGAATVDFDPLDISVGPVVALAFIGYPAGTTPALLTPQPKVAFVDAGGNTVTTDTQTITLSIDKNASTFTCTGGLALAAVAGVATFAGCTETVIDTGYHLTASASGVPDKGGVVFNVTSGIASAVKICWGTAVGCPQTPPSDVTGGTAMSTQPTVRVVDSNGNTVPSDNTTVVTLSISPGTPTSGPSGTLTCTGGLSKTVTAGVATFAGCAIDRAQTGYKLTATPSTTISTGQSQAFTVAVGPAAKLGYVVQPSTTNANAPFASNVQVGIADAGGNVITSGITATITLSIGTNPSGGVLTCTGGNTATTTGGIATFPACSIDKQGVGYTLVATPLSTIPVTTLTPSTSNPFTILAPTAQITLTPSSNVITWGQDVTFTIQFGINGAGKTFTLQVSKDNVNFSNISGATLATDAGGRATFVYGPSDNRYYRVTFAGAPDLSAGMSAVQRVVVRQTNQLRPAATSSYVPIHSGTSITFKSTVRPNRPELPQGVAHLVVYRVLPGPDANVLDRMVPVDRSDGVATLVVTFNTPGLYYVRSEAVPTPFNANSGWSGLTRYNVTG
jgi:hypothetical protein